MRPRLSLKRSTFGSRRRKCLSRPYKPRTIPFSSSTSPRNFIAGGGFFAKFLTLPVSLAWDAFGQGNGARSLAEVKQHIGMYRRSAIGPSDSPDIGCIVLVEPFFFAESEWIPCPPDFTLNTVTGKGHPRLGGCRRREAIRETMEAEPVTA
jgi:hypothetical protein